VRLFARVFVLAVLAVATSGCNTLPDLSGNKGWSPSASGDVDWHVVVHNLGTEEAKGAFRVVIGVHGTRTDGTPFRGEQSYTFPTTTVIPAGGVVHSPTLVTTPMLKCPRQYSEVTVLTDTNTEILESNETNNNEQTKVFCIP